MMKHSKKGVGRFEIEMSVRTSLLAVYSFVGAIVASLFLKSVDFLHSAIYPALERKGALPLVLGSFTAITASAVCVSLLLTVYMPSAAGSGIPQAKAAYRNDNGKLSLKSIWVRFLAGVIGLGGGFSLGSEGPTVYLGGATAANCGEMLGSGPKERKALSVAGAGAGLAAAFNTPLAALTFIIEEFFEKLSPRLMGKLLIATVIGAFTSWIMVGRHPAFDIPGLSSISLYGYMLSPVAALLGAAVGRLFLSRTIRLRERAKSLSLPRFLLPLAGGWAVWAIGIAVYFITAKMGNARLGIFGFGYGDLTAALHGEIAWNVALVLLAGKLLATMVAYAFAGCGGVFAPSLFFGTMAGLVVGGLASLAGIPVQPDGMLLLALTGMCACFGALDRAPLTAVLIVFEMTGRYEIVPALMVATVISQSYAYYFSDKINFYDAILKQDGITLNR